MHPDSCHGFVLSAFPLTDHSFVVTVFTREIGILKGVRRLQRGRRFTRVSLVPLTKVSLSAQGKDQQSLKRLTVLDVERSLFEFGGTYLGLALLQHLTFLVEKSQPENAADDRVYRLLDHCSAYLEKRCADKYVVVVLLYFESWLLRLCGMYPEPLHSSNAILIRLFKLNIEDFGELAIEWEGLKRALRALGSMWESYLSNELKTRTTLVQLLEDKGFL